MMFNKKITPLFKLEAEQSVLASIMYDKTAWDKIADIIYTDDFYSQEHKIIYEAMIWLIHRDSPVDWLTLSNYLKENASLNKVGGDAYLVEMVRNLPTTANVRAYAEIVKKAAHDRKLLEAAQRIVQLVDEQDDNRLDEAQKLVLSIAEKSTSEPTTLAEELPQVISDLIDRCENPGNLPGLKTGFDYLDKITNGFQKGDMIILAARPSMGKAQPLDAKILTSAGFINMGDIKIGDKIIGSDGNSTTVTGIFPQGIKPVYSVTFTDGTKTECTLDHLWYTQTRNERKRNCPGSVKTLKEIINTLKRESSTTPNHAIPSVAPVLFEKSVNLKLNPYLMGLLLGDATLAHPSIVFSKPELDLQLKLIDLLPEEDTAIPLRFSNGKQILIKRIKRNNKPSETRKILESYKLHGLYSHEKFIPADYMFSSIEERVQLLRGLIDTDGHVTESGRLIEFSTSSPQLAKDFCFLVRSLGGVAKATLKATPAYTYNGCKKTGKASTRIYASFPEGFIPVASEKHLKLWKKNNINRSNHKSIDSIEAIGEKECQCIKVSALDSLYVTDDFILTHNTLLALNIAENIAINSKEPVAFISLEMQKKPLIGRIICNKANINANDYQSGKLTQAQIEDVTSNIMPMLNQAPLIFEAGTVLSSMDIRAKCRRIKRKHGLSLIIVDYLTLIKKGAEENNVLQVGAISKDLKNLAVELNVPILVLSQLSRGVDNRPNKRPNMSDLRESGQIEQDADVVMFIYRDEVYDEFSADKGLAEIIISKHRNGSIGSFKLAFKGEYCRFENYYGYSAPVVNKKTTVKSFYDND
jgi:replicative DNA helicase